LLYRFERQQWLEASGKMAADPEAVAKDDDVDEGDKQLAGKAPSQVYGAEHLCRLFVSMPELIAQTNMDAQSVARLREELVKMGAWLSRNAGEWFVKVCLSVVGKESPCANEEVGVCRSGTGVYREE
jgi:mortality factor 4-like protein 1